MKQNYDGKHRAKDYEVGSWVFVHLQPYRQVSVALRGMPNQLHAVDTGGKIISNFFLFIFIFP